MSNIEQYSIIYKNNFAKLSQFARFYVRDDQAAEDIASESMIKLWETMETEIVEKPLALLLTIMRHKSLDYLRTQAATQQMYESMAEWQQHELSIRITTLAACNPDNIFSNEIQTIVDKALKELPSQTRKVFMMSRYESKSGKEIAEELGITVKGVDYHIAKALKVLRVSLKDYLPLFFFFFIHS